MVPRRRIQLIVRAINVTDAIRENTKLQPRTIQASLRPELEVCLGRGSSTAEVYLSLGRGRRNGRPSRPTQKANVNSPASGVRRQERGVSLTSLHSSAVERAEPEYKGKFSYWKNASSANRNTQKSPIVCQYQPVQSTRICRVSS